MEVKKFIRVASIIGILFYSLIKVTGWYDNSVIPNDINAVKAHFSNRFDSLNFLIVGNSYVYSGVNPTLFDSAGYRCLNFGFSTAGINYYDIVVSDYLTHCKKKPRKILLLINPLTFSSAADNWQAYPVHRYLIKPLTNEWVLFRYGAVRCYPGLLRKSSVKGIQYMLTALRGTTINIDSTYLKLKGFYPSDEVYNPVIFEKDKPLYEVFKKEKFPSDKVASLLILARDIQQQGIEVIFFEMPAFKLNGFFSTAYLKGYHNAICKIKSATFPVIPCESLTDSTCFRNIDHLNTKGSVIFTRDLLLKLKNYEK